MRDAATDTLITQEDAFEQSPGANHLGDEANGVEQLLSEEGTWYTCIQTYAQTQGGYAKALQGIDDMVQAGVPVSMRIYHLVMQTCCSQVCTMQARTSAAVMLSGSQC